MNRIILILCGFMLYVPSHATQVHYQREDSVKVMRLLSEAPRKGNLLVHFARQLKDIPYVGHTLEPFDKERLIINLRELDCTTMVENALVTVCILLRPSVISCRRSAMHKAMSRRTSDVCITLPHGSRITHPWDSARRYSRLTRPSPPYRPFRLTI